MVDLIRDGDIAKYSDFDNRTASRRKPLNRLPILDMSPFVQSSPLAERNTVARAMREACSDIGFFYLVGHGIPETELKEVVAWGHRLFELPESQKMALHVSKSPSRQGYVGVGGAKPKDNPDQAPDMKERFSMTREAFPGEPEAGRGRTGTSVWPEQTALPGFEQFMRAHIRRRTEVSQHLARAFALSLDLPETYFDETFRYPTIGFTLNYYRALDEAGLRKQMQWSISPHTDYNAFTLLSQDTLGGLECRNSAGEWIDIPPIPNTFVVNIGDLFARWTNDFFASTLHRATNVNAAGIARIAAPFFVGPQGASLVKCLESCEGPGNPARYEPIVAEEYVEQLRAQASRTGRPAVTTKTAERFNEGRQ